MGSELAYAVNGSCKLLVKTEGIMYVESRDYPLIEGVNTTERLVLISSETCKR